MIIKIKILFNFLYLSLKARKQVSGILQVHDVINLIHLIYFGPERQEALDDLSDVQIYKYYKIRLF